jgi:diguanylate cyclase (GGDEF)-like protein
MTAEVHSISSRRNIGNVKGLLHSLVPRATCFAYYNLARNCAWSSDGADDYELDNFVGDLPEEILHGTEPESTFLRRTLPSGRTILLLAIAGDESDGLGVLIAIFSRNAGKASWFNPNLIRDILLPVIDVIRDNLFLGMRLQATEQRADAAESELKLVYKLDEKIHGTSRSHSGLAQLVGQSGRYLGIAYSVLLLPAKRIRISATHSSWKHVNRKALDKYLLDSLFPKMEGQREPVVFEVPATGASDSPADQGYQVMLCPLLDATGNVEGAVAQLGRVSGEDFNADHVRFMSHIVRKVEYVITQSFDPMTGLMNRSGFEAQIHESMNALESGSQGHQMLYFDLDNLQLVNDTFGQSAGDEVIKRFGVMIEEHLPRNGVATRLTGDDFAILLTQSSDEDAMELATALRRNSDQLRYLKGDKSLQVTVSVGIAPFDARSGNEDQVLTAARIACDSAKDHGRDRIEVYDQHNQSIIRRFDDMHLVSEIQKALDADGFELQAQPIVALSRKNSTPHYEILLRMRDAEGKRISSSAFFSAAERYQLMPQIDRWVVSTTISSLQPHKAFLAESGAVFAVNLSGQSLGDDDIRKFIEDEIDSAGIPAGALCFEVTESAAVANRRKAQAFIDALRERGCRFALDDFGAGLSSFAYLKNFNVDTLKIDGSFIRDITDNRISESMVAAITQVAKVMELSTVAEYVESNKIKTLLKKLGVDFAQGHAIGKPRILSVVLDELTGAIKTSEA